MTISTKHVPEILLFGELADIGDPQRRTIIAVELATHLLARTRTTTQVRWHISSLARSQAAAGTAGRIVGHVCRRDVALWRHGVLEGTFCREMIALANSALDLCILELCLLLRLVALVLVAGFPRCHGSKQDVLGDADRVCLRAGGLALFLAELGPLLALGHTRVHGRFDDGFLDAPGRLVAPTVFANAVRGDGFGAVLVFGDGLRGEGKLGVVIFFGPVGAAVKRQLQGALVRCGENRGHVGFRGTATNFASKQAAVVRTSLLTQPVVTC
tara:strand:+ start:4335 stop:5147 length:813 start_codon:yes stop_codon:yes gene_type:complete